MSDPVVLITGALTGIGRATAIAFARKAPGSSLPLRCVAQPDEIANAILFLCSEASFTTGQVLLVSMAGSRRCEK